MYMYVHGVYVCVYEYLHICTRCLHVCVYIFTYMYTEFTYVCVYVYIYGQAVSMCESICSPVCTQIIHVSVYMFTYTHTGSACVCMCIYIYYLLCVHTYLYARRVSRVCVCIFTCICRHPWRCNCE